MRRKIPSRNRSRAAFRRFAPAVLALAALAAGPSVAQQTVTSGQYRIDGGTPLSLTITSAGAKTWTGAASNIATNALTNGPHYMQVQFTDSNSVTTAWFNKWFYVVNEPRKITGAEWFLDADPGAGNGHGVPLPEDLTWNGLVEAISFSVSGTETAALSTGMHKVYVRVKDQDGVWSRPYGAPFEVVPQDTIVAAEWVVDPDPAHVPFGAGYPMQAADGQFNSATESLTWSGTAPDALFETTECGHLEVYVRFKNSMGSWSFWQDPGAGPSLAINRAPTVESVSPPVGAVELPVGVAATFQLTSPADPDCDPITYEWTRDGNPEGANLPSLTWTPGGADEGAHAIVCLMKDDVSAVPGMQHAEVTFTWQAEVTRQPVVTVTDNPFHVTRGCTVDLHARTDPPNDTDYTWRSSSPSVATVARIDASTARVTGVTTGSVTITATGSDTIRSGSAQGTVADAVVTVTPNPALVRIGLTAPLTAESTHCDDTAFAWHSNNTALATVDPSTGVVTGVAQGTTKVTATGNVSGKTGETTVQVVPGDAWIDPDSLDLLVGGDGVLTAFSVDALDTSFTWANDNPTAVSLTGTGPNTRTATGLAGGTAHVTATGSHSGYVGTATIRVSRVSVSPFHVRLPHLGTETLTATSTAGDTDFTWTSDNPAIAAVTSQGVKSTQVVVTAVGTAGQETFIRATGTTSGEVGFSRISIITPIPILVNPPNASVAIGQTAPYSASGGDLLDTIAWSVQPATLGTFSPTEGRTTTFTAATPGPGIVIARGSRSHSEGQGQITVRDISVSVLPNPAQLRLGEAGIMEAGSSEPDVDTDYAWATEPEGIVTVEKVTNTTARVTAIATGATSVLATGNVSNRMGAASVTVVPAVAFDREQYAFRVDRDYNQVRYVTVVNDGPASEDVWVELEGTGIPAGFIGRGSMDTSFVPLPASEGLVVPLVLHAADAAPGSVLDFTAKLHINGETTVPTAPIQVTVNTPKVDFTLTEIADDPHSGARTLRIQNNGDTLTDVGILAGPTLEDLLVFRPHVTHARLESGASLDVLALPDLNLLKQGSAKEPSGYIVATALDAAEQSVLSVDFGCLAGSQLFTGTVQKRLITASVADWHATSEEWLTYNCVLPSGFDLGDVEKAELAVSFDPRSGWVHRPQTTLLGVNGSPVGSIENAIPRGPYEFEIPLATSPLYILGDQPSGQTVEVTVQDMASLNPGHYIVARDLQMVLAVNQAEVTVCAESQEAATAYLSQHPYFAPQPASWAVASLVLSDPFGQPLAPNATAYLGNIYTLDLAMADAPAPIYVVARPDNGDPALLLGLVAPGAYRGTWRPGTPSVRPGNLCAIDAFAGACHNGTATATVTLAAGPLTPEFEANPTTGRMPLVVQFSDLTYNGPASSWLWDFGDGATATDQHPVHVYTGRGSYQVSLTVNDDATEAKVDYVVTLGEPEDINGDNSVDAVDIQLVINGALGLDTGYNTDVNSDGVTDALDIQLVINRVLGITR